MSFSVMPFFQVLVWPSPSLSQCSWFFLFWVWLASFFRWTASSWPCQHAKPSRCSSVGLTLANLQCEQRPRFHSTGISLPSSVRPTPYPSVGLWLAALFLSGFCPNVIFSWKPPDTLSICNCIHHSPSHCISIFLQTYHLLICYII